MEIVNTEDMRKMDAEAIHEYGIPGIILMEHAAMAVWTISASMSQRTAGS